MYRRILAPLYIHSQALYKKACGVELTWQPCCHGNKVIGRLHITSDYTEAIKHSPIPHRAGDRETNIDPGI